MSMRTFDKNHVEVKAGDTLIMDDGTEELLYACNEDGTLGFNASRWYSGSELYPLDTIYDSDEKEMIINDGTLKKGE